MPSLIFPSPGMQVLSSFIFFTGVTILSHCVSRRIVLEDLTTWSSLKQIPWPRLCILLIFLDSWAFLFSSGIITFGFGLESHATTCAVAIYLCVFFYATSKILIYCFLIEKVHLVWSPTAGSRRLQSKVFLVSAVTVSLYTIVIVVMVIGKVTFLRENDDVCIIGLKPFSSIVLLAYDLYINVFLTALFLWPLLRSSLVNPRVKRVAIRTLIASLVALTTSTVNMAILTVMKGHQLGWVCLGSCGTDVIANALALFWVTSNVERATSVGVSSAGETSASAGGNLGGRRRPGSINVRAANVIVSRPPLSPATPDSRKSMYDYLPPTPTSAASSTTKVMFGQGLGGMGKKGGSAKEEVHELQVAVTMDYEVERDADVGDESLERDLYDERDGGITIKRHLDV